MKTIFDVLRWVIALLILYIVTNYAITGLLYVFEFIVRHLSALSAFLYWILILPILTLIFALYSTILSLIFKFIIQIFVRQTISLSITFGILFALSLVVLIILFWIGVLDLSWTKYPYSILNKILFTFFIGGLTMQVPITLYFSIQKKGSQNKLLYE